MCTGAEIALVAGSTALKAYDANRTRSEQNRIAEEDLRRNAMMNQRAGERVSQEVDRLKKSTAEPEREQLNTDFMEALKRAKLANGGPDLGDVGGASDRFSADTATARVAAGGEGKRLAANLARIDAPNLQRVREGRGFTDTATDLAMLRDRASGLDFLSRLRLARAQPNPGVDALASGMASYGTARAGRARPTGNTVGAELGGLI